MSLNGAWKKVKTENEAEFGAAIGATPEMAAVSAVAASYSVAGNDITIKRTYSTPGKKFIHSSRMNKFGSYVKYLFIRDQVLDGANQIAELLEKRHSGWMLSKMRYSDWILSKIRHSDL